MKYVCKNEFYHTIEKYAADPGRGFPKNLKPFGLEVQSDSVGVKNYSKFAKSNLSFHHQDHP